MIVDIHAQGFTVTPALAEHVRRRLHYVLTHRGNGVQRILVRLGGVDGCRGHNDMYCLMQIHMPNALVATIVHIGRHVRDVIDRATDRVGRLVAAHVNQSPREQRSTASSANPTLRRQVGALADAERLGKYEHKQPRCTTVQRSSLVSFSNRGFWRDRETGPPSYS